MKEVKSLEAFRKVESEKEWKEWINNYNSTHSTAKLDDDLFMGRYSIYDFARSNDKQASLRQLIAFKECEYSNDMYVLKDEYCFPIVYLVEIRYKDHNNFYVTASKERADKELATAEARGIDVIVTPYKVEDLE